VERAGILAPVSSPEITVRRAQPDDLPAVAAIDAESGAPIKEQYWRDRFRWCSAGPTERYFLVADRGGTCVGFIIGEVREWEFGSPASGWVFAVGVPGAERQHGIGTVLFEEICDRFRAVGVQHVRTMLSKDDLLVMSFFRSQEMMAGPFIQLEKSLR
jgi:ribosomal protein S18 acetylase RimI-like enzyme